MMTFEQKMAARRNGTTTVTVHDAPIPTPEAVGPLQAKLERHVREGKTEEQREAEAKAKADAEAAAKKAEAEAKAKTKPDDHKK